MRKSVEKEGFFRKIPLHPFLFALYPTIALLAWNIREVILLVAMRPLAISLLLAALIFIIMGLLFGNRRKAALITTLTLVLFFSYGHLYQYVVPTIGGIWGHHRVLGLIYLAIWIIGIISISRLRSFGDLTILLNLVTFILLFVPVFQIVKAEWLAYKRESSMTPTSIQADEVLQPEGEFHSESPLQGEGSLPDIYYIIVDSYVRSDSLLSDFGLDNSEFLNELKAMGFYIADCSRSNYTQTRLSLVSSLNMVYLQSLSDEFTAENEDKTSVDPYIEHNNVMKTLQSFGYKIIAIQSGISFTEFQAADEYFRSSSRNIWTRSIQPFESMLLNSTAMKILNASPVPALREFLDRISFPFYDYIDEERFILDHIDDAASLAGPKFVFVHIFPPHQPFLFKPDGSFTTDPKFFAASFDYPVDEEHYLEGYRDGVEFINNRLPEIIRSILSQSGQPPVMILQADHGQRGRNRMMILNAYYFPGDQSSGLYPTISPVNSFRILFNTFLGTNYPLLDDVSWYSDYNTPFDFREFGDPSEECR